MSNFDSNYELAKGYWLGKGGSPYNIWPFAAAYARAVAEKQALDVMSAYDNWVASGERSVFAAEKTVTLEVVLSVPIGYTSSTFVTTAQVETILKDGLPTVFGEGNVRVRSVKVKS